MSNKVYEIVTDRIIELLDRGVVPWNKPWKAKAGNKDGYISFTQFNLVTKKAYRGINPWLLTATAHEKGYTSPYWLSFKQAKQKGGYVREGEEGTMVVFWKRLTVTEKDKNGQDTTKVIPMLRYYHVYNLEQCEGIEAPAEQISSPINPDLSPIEACEQIIAGYEDCPKIHHGYNKAFYSPIPDTISMPDQDQFVDMEHYYSVLFHEAGHSTGHESRLHRSNFLSYFGSENYGKEELVAEMTAAFLCATAGIDNCTIEVNASYIASWKETIKADVRMIVTAAAQAQKAADHILGIKHTEEAA